MNGDVLLSPKTKDVLKILGLGTIIAASIVFPALPMAAKPFNDFRKRKEMEQSHNAWKRFNIPRLRQMLKRMENQKMVEIIEEDGVQVVKLTEKGRKRSLKYDLEDLNLKASTSWDRKWRVIIYDIEKNRKSSSETFRKLLKKMNFLKLQRSVYLTPYPCKDEIEYLRQISNLGKQICYLECSSLEKEGAYKAFFGLT